MRIRTMVIGGGIGGTATALALHKAGADVVVHEAHPDSAEDLGAFLTLASNGMRALAQIDAGAAVRTVGFPLREMRVLDAAGEEMGRGPLGEADDPSLRFRCVRRGDLNAALQAEAVRRGIDVRHGVRLTAVEEGPDGVTARFSDGNAATADLLVGADGLHSTVRETIAPGVRPRYAGQRVFYGYTGAARPPGTAEQLTMVRGSRAAFGYAVSPDGETYWFARVADVPPKAPGGWREPLVRLLREDGGPAADIVAATHDDVLATDAAEIPVGTPWRSARTLLVGDAAHAASPATGQGASMALEDAVVLAKSLRDAPDLDAALTRYEALRRPRVEHNITVSGALSRGDRPTGAPRPGEDDLVRLLDWNSELAA
ncbi:FAD-dependent monooxygenase [Streptomyces justiciae]|uniref:FAD-dependent monooxygenase n=1 Tax=Streptomyces justiciae TaxID=2780140 RepID=UPI0021179742|nr:FAD-dependent monooxygenase [Streptomyces justiciae]MCW8377411.1 FAD-dependent monooxygenase [Streptomyces justiciae]